MNNYNEIPDQKKKQAAEKETSQKSADADALKKAQDEIKTLKDSVETYKTENDDLKKQIADLNKSKGA